MLLKLLMLLLKRLSAVVDIMNSKATSRDLSICGCSQVKGINFPWVLASFQCSVVVSNKQL